MAKTKERLDTRERIINAALELFLEFGFTFTTNQMIVKKAKCSTGTLANCFRTKEMLLLEFVKYIAPFQFEMIEQTSSNDTSLEFLYCLEIAEQLTMCEQNEILCDLYVSAYSLPMTIDFIKEMSYQKSMRLFGKHLPDWTHRDFYEVETLTTGLVFGSLMEKCNPRYTIEQKVRRTLDNLLKLYDYSAAEREAVLTEICKLDLEKISKDTTAKILAKVWESVKENDSK